MFDKLRKMVAAKAAEVREVTGGPSDLHAVPAVSGRDLGDLDLAELGAYLGRTVEAVGPMGNLGPEATSMIGRRIQAKLREVSAGQALEPGELVPGQRAAMEQRLRESGADDAMIAQIRARIDQESAAHHRDGWEVVFSQGHRASVQLFPLGSEGADDYERLEHRWDRENGTDGHRPEDTALLSATVQRYAKGPYEAYCLSGRMAAKGSTHVAVVQSANVSSSVMVGLATLALRCVEPS